MDVREVARESIAETTLPSQPTVTEDKVTGDKTAEDNPSEGQPMELSGRKIHQERKASSSEVASFEMLKPAKTPDRVRVTDPSKEFVFEWKMTDAYSVRLSIADNNGNVIIDNQWISESRFGVMASEIADKGELDWTIEVTFNDGSMQRKTGKIEQIFHFEFLLIYVIFINTKIGTLPRSSVPVPSWHFD